MPWANSASSTTPPSRFRRRFRNTSTRFLWQPSLVRSAIRPVSPKISRLRSSRRSSGTRRRNGTTARRSWRKQSGATASLPYLSRNRARDRLGPRPGGRSRAPLPGTAADQRRAEEHYLGRLRLARRDRGRTQTLPAGQPRFRERVAIIDGTRSDVLDPRYRITLLSRMIYLYREYVDALVVQHDDLRALRIAESSRARVLAERLGRDFNRSAFADPAALRAFARNSKAALLSFWIAPERSFAWLITGSGVRRFDLPPAAEIEALVTGYRQRRRTLRCRSADRRFRIPVVGEANGRGCPGGPAGLAGDRRTRRSHPPPQSGDAGRALAPAALLDRGRGSGGLPVDRDRNGEASAIARQGVAATHWRAGLQGDGL